MRNIKAALERKYASILGQLVAGVSADNPDALREKLAAIQIVIRLWEPDWTPDHIKPIRPKKTFVTQGLQSRLLREFIRKQSGEFSSHDAATYVQDRLKALGETPPPLQNLKNSAHQTFRKLEGKFVTALRLRPEKWKKLNK